MASVSYYKGLIITFRGFDKKQRVMKTKSLEAAAKAYNPSPIALDDIFLPESLIELTEAIAENTHNCWAKCRLDEGWSYGPQRNNESMNHPDLLPYDLLPEAEKEYDRRTAMNALKLIVKLGYKISK